MVVNDGKKFLMHPVKPKHTLFSISKYYALGLAELYEHNPEFRSEPTLTVGSRLMIPVPNKAIKRFKTDKFVASKNTPIYYVVQHGDNLYQICKRYFDMPIDSVMKRNKLKNTDIKPGKLLLVGWMGTQGIDPVWRPVRQVAQSDVLKKRFKAEVKGKKTIDSQGVCIWLKDSKEKDDLYALHREAEIGSTMEILNPQGNRTVYAKVIGRIPDGYERNVEVVVSPAAARKIAAPDTKFFVKVKYVK